NQLISLKNIKEMSIDSQIQMHAIGEVKAKFDIFDTVDYCSKYQDLEYCVTFRSDSIAKVEIITDKQHKKIFLFYDESCICWDKIRVVIDKK
ncbi:MAG: hypothetical protein ACK5G7_05270, partial [Erysipelotrichaceae bacterium]